MAEAGPVSDEEDPGEESLGSFADGGEFNLSSLSGRARFGDLFKDDPSILDSILLHAWVNIAKGLTFESKSYKRKLNQ